jgi:hypothetical protein
MLGGNLLILLGGGTFNGNGGTSRPVETAYTEMLALNSAKFRLTIRTEEHKTIHDVENPHANRPTTCKPTRPSATTATAKTTRSRAISMPCAWPTLPPSCPNC